MNCPECSSTNCNVKPGYHTITLDGTTRRRVCKECHCEFKTNQPKHGDESIVEVVVSKKSAAKKSLRAMRRVLIMDAYEDVVLSGKVGSLTRLHADEVRFAREES